MKLESFSVENYRSITQARRLPLSDSTVLAGPNNEGKSNILRALNAAMYALERHGRRPLALRMRMIERRNRETTTTYDWDRDFPLSLRKMRSPKETKIILEFRFNDDDVSAFKDEIKSNLNGTLPVCVTFGEDSQATIHIIKQGLGSKTLNAKAERIALFLARRVQFQYIPAVRTAQYATNVVQNIVSSELRSIEENPEFASALLTIRNLQKPILEALSVRTTETLKGFVPNIRKVMFEIDDELRASSLGSSVSIKVDDGNVTSLNAKGDGIQSLVALGLRRHVLEESRAKRSYIFAVEEPESHLHPDAVHELKVILSDIAKTDQVIISTHSGLLANRLNVESNIIVSNTKANPAKDLAEIRKALGIRSHDNLVNSELVLLVEGDDDKLAMRALLMSRSHSIRSALQSGRLIIESLDGAGSLGAKIGLYKSILCNIHCFLDHDSSGQAAWQKAETAGLVDSADINFALLGGKHESEFEDLVELKSYASAFLSRFGVDVAKVRPRNRKAKWSARMADVFLQVGKPFDDLTKQRAKFIVADAVAADPSSSMTQHSEPIMASLTSSLERKLH